MVCMFPYHPFPQTEAYYFAKIIMISFEFPWPLSAWCQKDAKISAENFHRKFHHNGRLSCTRVNKISAIPQQDFNKILTRFHQDRTRPNKTVQMWNFQTFRHWKYPETKQTMKKTKPNTPSTVTSRRLLSLRKLKWHRCPYTRSCRPTTNHVIRLFTEEVNNHNTGLQEWFESCMRRAWDHARTIKTFMHLLVESRLHSSTGCVMTWQEV